MFRVCVIGLWIWGAGLLGGCASHDVVYAPSLGKQPEYAVQQLVVDELIVRTRAIEQEEVLKRQFGLDLMKDRVLPVVVYLENGGPQELLIYPENITLHHPDAQISLEPMLLSEAVGVAEKNIARAAAWGAVLSWVGVLASWENVKATNERIAGDYYNRSLRRRSLKAGGYTEGTLFYRLPKLPSISGDWVLKATFPVKNIDKQLQFQQILQIHRNPAIGTEPEVK